METQQGMFEQSVGGSRFSQTPIWRKCSCCAKFLFSMYQHIF